MIMIMIMIIVPPDIALASPPPPNAQHEDCIMTCFKSRPIMTCTHARTCIFYNFCKKLVDDQHKYKCKYKFK